VGSLYLTFPMHLVKGPVVDAFEKALGKGKQGRYGVDPKVTIGDMSPYLLSGVSMERVTIQLASSDPDPGATVDLDEVTARVGIFSLLLNDPTLSFSVDLYEGSIDGEIALRGDKKAADEFLGHTFAVLGGRVGGFGALDVEVDGIDISKAPPVLEKTGVPVTGVIGGTIALDLGEAPEKDAKGKIDLAVKTLTLGPGELQIPVPGLTGGLTLPLIDMGDLIAKADIKEGKGKFDKLGLTGKDFSADVEGDLKIAKAFSRSRLDTSGWFQISESFLEQNSKFKTILDFASPLKRARDDDGKYHFDLKGSVGKPRFNLSRNGGKSGSGRGSSGRRGR
jgi:type II secretion system protein N